LDTFNIKLGWIVPCNVHLYNVYIFVFDGHLKMITTEHAEPEGHNLTLIMVVWDRILLCLIMNYKLCVCKDGYIRYH
jgi:hypothetical protein